MLTIFIIVVLLIAYAFRIFKHENLVLFTSIFFLLILGGSTITGSIVLYIKQLQTILSYNFVVYIILVAIYLISELMLLLGMHKYIEQKIIHTNEKIQKLYVLGMSIFSTNIVLGDSYIIKKYPSIFYTNSFILSTVNVISVTFLTISIFVAIIFDNGSENFFYLFLASNFFAIFWLIKNVIDIITSNNIEIDYNEKRTILLESSNVGSVVHYKNYNDLLYSFPIYFITLLTLCYIFKIQMLIGVCTALIFLLFHLFIKSQLFVYKTKSLEEKIIYQVLVVGFVSVFKQLILIINSMILITIFDKFFMTGIYLNQVILYYLILLIMSIAIFITLYSKRFEFGLITLIPIFYLVTVKSTFVNIHLYYLLIGILIFVKHISIINYKNKKIVLQYLIGFIASTMCYATLIVTKSFIFAYLMLSVCSVLYLIFILVAKKR